MLEIAVLSELAWLCVQHHQYYTLIARFIELEDKAVSYLSYNIKNVFCQITMNICYLKFINFSLGAGCMVRQNLQ